VQAYDLVGQGCAAALCPTCSWRGHCCSAGTADHVLSVCVEVSSAAMYLDNDPGVIISACLFGDGAGAAVLSRHARRRPACVEGQQPRCWTRASAAR
jgi:polyketide synthase Type III